MSTMILENMTIMSVSDAAAVLGVTTGRVIQLIHERKLQAKKLTERAWAVDVKSVQAYAKSDRRPGPKPSA